jgi:pimeloyl-ACP methyl ester carboxylesterase/SAM-dependent methyltransferase
MIDGGYDPDGEVTVGTNERMVTVEGIELCAETFGDPAHPAILLISGAGASMDWWPDEFCRRLAAGLRYVVRYDHRDTGRSVTYPPGSPGYGSDSLNTDAVGLLDALGVGPAHVVGISMGGGIGQELAIEYGDRVATLTLIATSPVSDRSGLPPMSPDLRAYFDTTTPPDWSDRAAVIDHLVEFERVLAGPYFDEALTRQIATRVVDRSTDPAAGLTNHLILPGDGRTWRLSDVRAPTLVIHGTLDPMFPLGHGRALAEEIPNADLLELPDVGHEVPPPSTWDVVVPALLRHTSGGWEEQAGRLARLFPPTAGEPGAWFDRLYAAARAGEVDMPWDRSGPQPLLAEWAQRSAPTGEVAVIVGCGLGGDAEFVASLGLRTVAFDVSDSAIAIARHRFPDSTVDYRVASLLDPPAEWSRAFDLVVEIHTVQALPRDVRARAIGNVADLVAPGGTLLVIAFSGDADRPGPPWPLTRTDVDSFTADGLQPVMIEENADGTPRWRAEFRRP